MWDAGTYRNLNERDGREIPMGEALAAGHAKFWLEGQKLRGGWALTRFRTGKDESWLLVKMDDERADPRHEPVNSRPESVLTGRTLEQIASDEGSAEWQSDRPAARAAKDSWLTEALRKRESKSTAGDAGDAKTMSLKSGRNACASDAGFIFADEAKHLVN